MNPWKFHGLISTTNTYILAGVPVLSRQNLLQIAEIIKELL